MTNPNLCVFVFDGDGSLPMNLGSQATIAEADPPNLYHLMFSNGMHEVNGMHPIQSRDKIDFAVIALSCGYRDAANCAEADV